MHFQLSPNFQNEIGSNIHDTRFIQKKQFVFCRVLLQQLFVLLVLWEILGKALFRSPFCAIAGRATGFSLEVHNRPDSCGEAAGAGAARLHIL